MRGRRGAIGGPGFGGRAEVEVHAGRDAHDARVAVKLDCAPARAAAGSDRRRGRGLAARRGEQPPVAVVAGELERRADRRVDGAVGQLALRERQRRAPRRSSGCSRVTGRPARAFSCESSESARKRLHARSIASSSARRRARAPASARGSVQRSTTRRAERLPARGERSRTALGGSAARATASSGSTGARLARRAGFGRGRRADSGRGRSCGGALIRSPARTVPAPARLRWCSAGGSGRPAVRSAATFASLRGRSPAACSGVAGE